MREGWICPRCQASNSPDERTCAGCSSSLVFPCAGLEDHAVTLDDPVGTTVSIDPATDLHCDADGFVTAAGDRILRVTPNNNGA